MLLVAKAFATCVLLDGTGLYVSNIPVPRSVTEAHVIAEHRAGVPAALTITAFRSVLPEGAPHLPRSCITT